MGKPTLIFKLWECVSYSPIYKCCGNCDHTIDVDWDDGGDRVCNVLGDHLKFPITETGICRFHSSFKRGNTRWA